MTQLRRMSSYIPYLVGYFVLLLVWDVVLNMREDKSTLANYFYAVAYSLPYLIVALISFRRLLQVGVRSSGSKALLFMSIGATIFTIAFWVYTYFILSTNVDVPYPSLADYLFLSFVPLVAIGFAYLIRIFTPVITRKVVIQSFLLVVVGVALMYFFVILPKMNQDIPTLEKVFDVIYPLNDSILIALILIALRTSGGRIHGYFSLFILTFCVMITGDLTYSFRTSHGIQWNGDIADLIFTFAAFFFSLAILRMIDTVISPSEQKDPVLEPVQT